MMEGPALAHFLKAGGLRTLLRPSCKPLLKIRVRSLPRIEFSCEQSDILGPLGTGAALWYADRILAEYFALKQIDLGNASLGGHKTRSGAVLVLGCGVVPLSGFVAHALGWKVLLTDLDSICAVTQVNVSKNAGLIATYAQPRPTFLPPTLGVQPLPFGDPMALQAAMHELDDDTVEQFFILSSDCIWMESLHRPLLSTIYEALQKRENRKLIASESSALIAFTHRDRKTEASFFRLAKSEFGMAVVDIDLQNTFSGIEWPEAVSRALSSGLVKMSDQFKLKKLFLNIE